MYCSQCQLGDWGRDEVGDEVSIYGDARTYTSWVKDIDLPELSSDNSCSTLATQGECLASKEGGSEFENSACYWCCGKDCDSDSVLCEPTSKLLSQAMDYNKPGKSGAGVDSCPVDQMYMSFDDSTTAVLGGTDPGATALQSAECYWHPSQCALSHSWVTGGSALDLVSQADPAGDGSNIGFLRVPGPFDLSSGYTVCAWLWVDWLNPEPGGWTGTWQTAFGPWESQTTTMHFGVDANDNCLSDYASDGGYESVRWCGLEEKTWTYACSLATNGRFEMWINGKMEDQRMSGTINSDSSTQTAPLFIGAKDIGENAYGANPWRGKIDEVQLFTYALDAVELEALYTSGPPAPPVSPPPPDFPPGEVPCPEYELLNYAGDAVENLPGFSEELYWAMDDIASAEDCALLCASNGVTYFVYGLEPAGDPWSYACWCKNEVTGAYAGDMYMSGESCVPA